MLVSVTVIGTSVVETDVLTDTDIVVTVDNSVAVVVSVSNDVAVVVMVVGTTRTQRLANLNAQLLCRCSLASSLDPR